MIDLVTRYSASVDLGACGFSARGAAFGLAASCGFAWPHTKGLYALYRGYDDAASIDYNTPVGVALAGATSIAPFEAYPLAASSVHWFGIRAISPGGVEEKNTDQVQLIETDTEGVPLPIVPNAPHSLVVVPRAGGTFSLAWRYNPTNQSTHPVAYAIYHDNGSGTINYVTPLATVVGNGYVTAAYAHDTSVKFAVRAIATSGAKETNTVYVEATADNEGPDTCEAPTISEGSEIE